MRAALLACLALTGCLDQLCAQGTSQTTERWDDVPTAGAVAVGAVNIAMVADGALRLVEDERVSSPIDLGPGVPSAMALAPDGSGIAVSGGMFRRFTREGVVTPLVELAPQTGNSPVAVFDGTAFLIAYTLSADLWFARVFPDGSFATPPTFVGQSCASSFRFAMARGTPTWLMWQSSDMSVVVTRIRDGVPDPAPRVVTRRFSSCNAGAMSIATRGLDTLALVRSADGSNVTALGFDADGELRSVIERGGSADNLVATPQGFALLPRASGFPVPAKTRLALLDARGESAGELVLRGGNPAFAVNDTHVAVLVRDDGLDPSDDERGDSWLATSRLYDEGQSPLVRVTGGPVHHVETHSCVDNDPN